MTGTQLVDDLIDRILELPCLFHLICLHQGFQLQEQLRHCAVGSADAAFRADGKAADELLVGTVENDVILTCGLLEHLDILYRHG